METIQIKIERITYANQETGYVVLRGMLKNRQITAVGIIPEVVTGANLAGIEYQFQGGWQRSKYGYQFVFDQATLLTNRLYYFLAKVVKGLGEKTSRRLIDHYGENQLIEIIEKTPERLLEFKGIKEKKLAKIKTSWEKQKDIRELATYLLPYGITPNLIVRIYNHFERDAVKKIQENPYLLTEIRGIGFKTADDIASRLGIPYDSTFRIQAAVIHLLMEAGESDGHTYLPATELQKK
ncbi:MAG TPA: exodeoxyribonuclease V subunit alpha, partial [Proteobacteria bacterium]|nr:exodeoxyribonuclease V subunit alpha [Pseudomonadota bacterium]